MCKHMMRQAVSIRRAAFASDREAFLHHWRTSVKKLPSLCLSVCLTGGAFMTGDSALAHHSFAAFEYGASIELEGTVQEFKYVNPHSSIILKVKGKDGRVETWTLEGQPTPMLERAGWTHKTLKPGDQIKATISPLRSGGTGGSWTPEQLHFRDGKAVAVGR
jgi:hypothetical protein